MEKHLKNILVIGGLHGDESSGIAIAKYFQQHSHNGISSFIGNPAASVKNKRYLETDLNRSFDTKVATSLEERRAEEIKPLLKKFDFIIDFHNTKGDFTTCAITTVKPNKVHIAIALHFGFKKLVIMPPSGSLISRHAQNAISFEIATNERNKFPINIPAAS